MDIPQAIGEAQRTFGLTSVQMFAQGGQKVVCRAKRATDGVVLKVVLLSAATDPMALERCRREVALLRDLDAENIVRVLTDLALLGGGPDATAWLEEELDGDDLRNLLGRTWAWPEVRDMLLGVAAGLDAMHDHGYVHRDLSAGNVRRTSAGIWKVMDPGLAKHLNRSSITGLWQPGTLGFMSPEHAVPGGRVTPASDVFCLGILAYLCLVGDVPIPFTGDINDYRRRLLTPTPISLAAARPGLPNEVVDLLDQALNVQPARRFLDAGELLTAVQGVAP